jgi:prenylated cyclic peptide (anacyclamide/piricyclamide family)
LKKLSKQTKEKHTMIKKNIRPQQVAPVQRDTTATSYQSGLVTPLYKKSSWEGSIYGPDMGSRVPAEKRSKNPFAGDDAE